MAAVKTDILEIDVGNGVRPLNALLHEPEAAGGPHVLDVHNPRGQHNVAVGARWPAVIEVRGHVGYYAAAMNQAATVHVHGNAGKGLAENIMSGSVHVFGDASDAVAASGHGGLVVVHGNAASRCGISMKGVDIVVRGSVGHMSAFMAQEGTLVVCGDAGDALGDSLYEARIFVRGHVKSLGADCEEKTTGAQDRATLEALLARSGFDDIDPSGFRMFGSARRLYHFHIDNAAAY
jgi:glutamate synthase domain-containing protein 3